MKRTQSAFALLIAILASFGVIVAISRPINRWIQSQPNLAEWISTATYGAVLLVFFTVYGALQSRQAKKQLHKETSLLQFSTPRFQFIDSLGGLGLILLLLLLPAIRLGSLSLARISVATICILAYLALLRISRVNLIISCTRHHILILGFDARIMIPDPNGHLAYANPTGILAYDRIQGYRLSDTQATLYLRNESDPAILIPIAGETAKQLEGVLAMHHIPRWYPETV
jgi:hypothetical protein